jgi:hypothetical protein
VWTCSIPISSIAGCSVVGRPGPTGLLAGTWPPGRGIIDVVGVALSRGAAPLITSGWGFLFAGVGHGAQETG